ncbi:exodeoxyribonuclease VII large subunit [Pseudodesulfovibrio sp. F-1]|uniref:Exodeoxyribonuclease 7 large subunit n=1 Tax=Pseudodesulfovibrio alkaliphilus TaxID=2661613 RepID=A0A7K1KS08_9BACT|nr:exodeoxyribonuclease VII large subunit [Pseudodesulfovibrio alkaliphilus]MUM78875.1 exodeoxyribonuclease VII large subunit [Pseudodesulfovibrio alkaliphilus]
MSVIFTVSELTRSVKDLLEAEFPFVWVRGQVTNLARPVSGHLYFTLTDGDAALSVVWFKSAQQSAEPVEREGERFNPLTGEVEEAGAHALAGEALENGQEVLCAGRLNVYEPRGQYQLVAELVQAQGVGDLAMAFEALKRKLADKGYFDEDRKLALPCNPARVAVITSPSGAAIRDFLRIAGERGTGGEIRIHPALVQGDRAPGQIAAALDLVDAEGWAEVAVLIRGGGSLEDLWAFNTEEVADAIHRARLPVLTGVGHEPDVTIADFVADKRAATPSHAAQELWPRRETLAQQVDTLELALGRAYAVWLRGREESFRQLRRALVWLSPVQRLGRLEDRHRALLPRLQAAGRGLWRGRGRQLAAAVDRLDRAFGPFRVEQARGEMAALCRRMDRAVLALHQGRERDLAMLCAALRGLDPEAPLERGYALVRIGRTGQFLRGPKEVTPGESLDIRVRDGRVAAVVAETRTETREKE